MNLRAILLSPFALINAIVLRMRHGLYDLGILASEETGLKFIRVGNLAFGGTGKTPFTEYLISVLQSEFNVGVVSRGYGRNHDKLLEVGIDSNASEVGDEPLQIKRKFPQVPIYVFSNRAKAIKKLNNDYPNNDLIILDDALQHRKLKGGLSLLLTKADQPFTRDFLFPSGYLRDIRKRAHQADAIVVTKSKPGTEYSNLERSLERYKKPIFFSHLLYDIPVHINSKNAIPEKVWDNALLITGIASPEHLKEHLNEQAKNWSFLTFKDHHNFTHSDLQKILEIFKSFKGTGVIFTTEKDAVRLTSQENFNLIADLPIYIVSVRMKLVRRENELLDLIRKYAG